MQAGIRDIKVIALEGQGTRMWNSQELQSVLTVNEGWQHFVITHWGRVTHICVSPLCWYWFRQFLVAWSAPSHCLNRWWFIINWDIGNIFQWNLNKINIFSFIYCIWKFRLHNVAFLSPPQCIKQPDIKTMQMNEMQLGTGNSLAPNKQYTIIVSLRFQWQLKRISVNKF